MADLDRPLAAAIARKLRDCGTANPDVVAVEIIAIVRGQGWRPVSVLPLPDWKAPRTGGPPDPASPGGAEYAAARAALTGGGDE
jgi:hypothetical protein